MIYCRYAISSCRIITQCLRRILARVFSPRTTEHLWIGASDIATEGSFVWVNGWIVTSDVIHWSSGQPDDYRNNEDCVHMISGHTSQKILANDRPCSDSLLAICEKPV